MNKKILRIDHPTSKHWVGDGFHVAQMIPGYGREMSDETSPFLMLDYNAPLRMAPRMDGHRPGVGFHPHRGFETVTIVYSGEVEHQDTAGNGGIIGKDEVQWMTAGSGLLHSEFFTGEFSRMGGEAHFAQLWVNLPREYKMVAPRYQALTKENISEVQFDGGIVRVIAGEYGGEKGGAQTYSPIELYDVRFDTGGVLSLSFPEGYAAMILVIEGDIESDEKKVEKDSIVFFSRTGEHIELTGSHNAKILIMSGKPFGEPVVNYGPFVMNSQEEIMQAFRDLQAGKMGRIDE